MASKKDESVDITNNTCVVCFKGVDIYSIGQCDHPVCFECSTRMRVLCRQNECPICRQDMPKVIFTKCIRPFNSIKNGLLTDYKFKICFETKEEVTAFELLLAHECPKCKKIFSSFTQLRDHVRRTHLLNYCDLCVENLKILSRERRCYTRQELATHRRIGDSDDRSHRGHPLCEFCDTRYMDNDELYRHLRREHLFCHYCDADGLHQYYNTYDFLREHFRNEHYLCEEGECYNEKFTAVFRTDIDYKAHKTVAHGKGLGKAGLKQARTLDIEFTLVPRPRPLQRNRHYREDDIDAGAVGGTLVEESNPPDRNTVFSQLNTNCIEEFPSLGGNSTGPSLSGQLVTSTAGGRNTASSVTRRGGCTGGAGGSRLYEDDFPALGPDTTQVSLKVNSERPANTAAKQTPSSNNTTTRPSSTNVSIQVNHPRFTTTVTSHNTYNYHFPALDSGGTSVTVPTGTSTSVHWTAKRTNDNRQQPPPTTHNSHNQGTITAVVASGHDPPPPGPEAFPALTPTTNNNKTAVQVANTKVTSTSTNNLPSNTSTNSNTASTTSDQPTVSNTKPKKKKSKSKSTNSIPAEGSSKDLEGNNKKKGNIELKNSGDSSSSLASSKKKSKENLLQTTNGETKSNNINNNNNRKVLKSPKLENVKANQLNHIEKKEEISKPVKENEKNGQEPVVEKKKDKVKPLSERVVTDPEAFPALGGSGVPPGFLPKWKVKRPPPGLEKPVNLLPVTGKTLTPPPPGFNPLNGFPPLGNETDSTKLKYTNPPNFDERNSALVTKMTTALGPDSLELFRQVSFSFRSGNIPPSEYYSACQQIMGPNTFSELFPELLALLPDIEKQQELWTVYKNDQSKADQQQQQQPVRTSSKKKGAGSSSTSSTNINKNNNHLSLEVCATCYQVLTSTDLRHHLTRHVLDNHFPALDSQNSTSFNNNPWVQHSGK